VLREAAGVLFVARVEGADQRLQSLAEGAETDDQQPRPGRAVYRAKAEIRQWTPLEWMSLPR
jgi:hypothetical protein